MRNKFARGVRWQTVTWLSLVHIGCLVPAFFFFTWKGVLACFLLVWITGGIGVCLGYHRYLTHNSFSTSKPIRWLLAFLGGLSGEGSALDWASWHRKHHQHSDQPGDPHSPNDGFAWSHVLWLLPWMGTEEIKKLQEKWVPDLRKDWMLRFLHHTFLVWHVVLGSTLFALGLLWNLYTAVSLVVWGMFVRMVLVLHSTWFVNSATHRWGYRTYQTRDNSRNLWWVALLTFGEGWHNNHHYRPRAANHGHRWWELDITYWTIKLLAVLGLARRVHTYLPTTNRD